MDRDCKNPAFGKPRFCPQIQNLLKKLKCETTHDAHDGTTGNALHWLVAQETKSSVLHKTQNALNMDYRIMDVLAAN
eukprot:2645477-Amphidinium_carterae.1